MINNFYFLVLYYLESWLNLMIVSMLVLGSGQVGDLWNCEPQKRWLCINARLNTLSVLTSLGQNISKCDSKPTTPKLCKSSKSYYTQSSVQATIPMVIIKKSFNFVCRWCDLIFTKKHNTETRNIIQSNLYKTTTLGTTQSVHLGQVVIL